MWLTLLYAFIAQVVVQLLAPAKVSNAKPVALGEVDIPTASETRAQSMVFGTVPIAGNVIWYGDYQPTTETRRVRVSWFKTETQTIGYRYNIGLWLSLSATPCDAVREIRLGDHIAWSGNQTLSKTATTDLSVSATWARSEGQEVPDGMAGTMRFFNTAVVDGPSSAYPANTYMVAQAGGPVPAYPNTCHAVWLGPSLTSAAGDYLGFVGSTPNIEPLKITLKRLPALSAAITAADDRPLTFPYTGSLNDGTTLTKVMAWAATVNDIDGFDCNPALAIAEILSTRVAGVGPRLSPFTLDLQSFFRAAQTLFDEGHGLSFAWETSKPSSEIVLEILKQINGQFEFSTANAVLGIRLIRATDPVLETFDDSNIIKISESTQRSQAEAVNVVRLTFADRASNFQSVSAVAKNHAGIAAAGAEIVQEIDYIGVSNRGLAEVLADRDLRALSSPLWQVRFDAVVQTGVVRRPGDVIVVPTPAGVPTRMRIKTIRYGDYGSRTTAEIEALEDVFYSGVAGAGGVAAPAPTVPAGLPASLTGGVLAPAPYALTGTETDTLMYYGRDPDISTDNYFLALKEQTGTWAASVKTEYSVGPSEPAIVGTLNSAMTSSVESPTVALTLTAAGVQQWKKASRSSLIAVAGSEWIYLSAFTLSGSVLTAGIVQRGCYDTTPSAHAAGSEVVVLLDFSLDVKPLKTKAGSQTLAGLDLVTARAESRGTGGTLPADLAATSQATWTYVDTASRAPRTLPPGRVRLAGVAGVLSATETAPTVTRASALALTWNNRNRLLRQPHPFFDAASFAEPGAYVYVNLAYESGSGIWNDYVVSANATAGATTMNLSMSGVSAGARRVRVTLRARCPYGTSETVAADVVMYWTLSA